VFSTTSPQAPAKKAQKKADKEAEKEARRCPTGREQVEPRKAEHRHECAGADPRKASRKYCSGTGTEGNQKSGHWPPGLRWLKKGCQPPQKLLDCRGWLAKEPIQGKASRSCCSGSQGNQRKRGLGLGLMGLGLGLRGNRECSDATGLSWC